MTVVVGSVRWLGQSSDRVGNVGLLWGHLRGCGQLVGKLADLEMPWLHIWWLAGCWLGHIGSACGLSPAGRPGLIHMMVSWFQAQQGEGQPQHRGGFWVSACALYAIDPVAKANCMAKPRARAGRDYWGWSSGREVVTATFANHPRQLLIKT